MDHNVFFDLSCLPGPRNWHPRARTAAHRFEESCWGFWCCKMSSVTVRSPRERAALMALTRPSSSTSWQWTRVTSFLCMGLLSKLWAVLLRPTPGEKLDRRTETKWKRCSFAKFLQAAFGGGFLFKFLVNYCFVPRSETKQFFYIQHICAVEKIWKRVQR